jgi:hypothetical protein
VSVFKALFNKDYSGDVGAIASPVYAPEIDAGIGSDAPASAQIIMASLGAEPSQALPAQTQSTALSPFLIDNPGKIGIGTWEVDGSGTAAADLAKVGVSWYYDWGLTPLSKADGGTGAEFVPMVWGTHDAGRIDTAKLHATGADTLLAFNEPDHGPQANMSVDQAIGHWQSLMDTGLRLGSPATTVGQALGQDSWLGRFMTQIDQNGYSVDFIAVHYYSDNPDISAFKAYLEAVHQTYDLPIWVTEWALVDWNNPDRFSLAQTAAFAEQALYMLDDLAYVERHAWFAPYDGGDGWHINTELFDADGGLTLVGDVFSGLSYSSTSAFTDGMEPVVSEGLAQSIARLYEASLDRAFDAPGVNFWIDQWQAGKSLHSIADFFLESDEFVAHFGSIDDTTASDFVGVLYANILEREANDKELSYWVDQLSDGQSHASVLLAFSDSSENIARSDYLVGLAETTPGLWDLA